MLKLTKSELVKLIEQCNDDAEIIIQNDEASINIENGECLDIKELEVYTDTIFILVTKENN